MRAPAPQLTDPLRHAARVVDPEVDVHGTTLTDAVRDGAIELGGDRRLARKFFTLFPQAAVDP